MKPTHPSVEMFEVELLQVYEYYLCNYLFTRPPHTTVCAQLWTEISSLWGQFSQIIRAQSIPLIAAENPPQQPLVMWPSDESHIIIIFFCYYDVRACPKPITMIKRILCNEISRNLGMVWWVLWWFGFLPTTNKPICISFIMIMLCIMSL